MGLVTEYPLWYILFCILLAAAYAGFLYYRSKTVLPRRIIWMLAGFRFLSVFLITFLLLSPLIKKRVKLVEKPLIVIGIDQSQSVLLGNDSAYYRSGFPTDMAAFIKKLETKFEVRTNAVGESVREDPDFSFNDKVTDLSSFFSDIEKRFAGRNVGAVVLATDGLYNRGSNPSYTARRITWPVYAVAMGDTIRKRDLLIRKVIFNRQAFLGDHFPVEILIEAQKCDGAQPVLKVMEGNVVIADLPVKVNGDRYSRKFSLVIEAKEKGLHHYTISLSAVGDEFTLINNRGDIYVDVLDERQKILILYDAPHPDIAAMRQALESGIRFDVSESELQRFSGRPEQFDLIILYQLPSLTGVWQPDQLMKSSASLLFVLGTRTDLSAFNALKTGLVISSQKSSFSESQPAVNTSFPLFVLEPDIREVMADFPPLLCPFGTYQSSPLSDILLYQKIGQVTASFPMAIFFRSTDRKTGVITGENLWRWRLSDFSQKGNHDVFNELFSKIAMYLSVRSDKSFFRVTAPNTIPENEPVSFSAQVYNPSYELINDPDVNLVVRDENGKDYPFVMAKTGHDYYLTAGNFSAGEYSYEASVVVGKNKYTKHGLFMVAPVNLEALNTVADLPLLSQIATSHEGVVLTPDGLPKLAENLLKRDDIASVAHFNKRFSDLAGTWWLLALIIALLAAEWGIRKRSGM